jgi:predicted acylesterase/phospholipase RssA
VIAVDVEEYSLNNPLRQGLDILLQVDQMRLNKLNNLILAGADFVIKPAVQGINWVDFSKANLCIQEGKQAIQEVVPILRKNIAHRRRKNFLRNCLLR